MSSIVISSLVFLSVFSGALLGLAARSIVPEHHLQEGSRDTVRLAVGLIATLAALVLGLLVASAKESYDTQRAEVQQITADVVYLDRLLDAYGADAHDVRLRLREAVPHTVARIWLAERPDPSALVTAAGGRSFYDAIIDLQPKDDRQRLLQQQALDVGSSLAKLRYLIFAQSGGAISLPFLVVLSFWLTVIFFSFGLFAPVNATVVAALFVCALSVAGSLFLTLELNEPFSGVVQIPRAPLLEALLPLPS